MAYKTLQVDDKWSIEYDPNNNDSPRRWLRYGDPVGHPAHVSWDESNAVTAMFYALLEKSQES